MSFQPHLNMEPQRLEALKRYGILDTPSNPALDELTELAAQLCDAPIAIISLVDEKRLFFKSRFGTSLTEIERCDSFCDCAIGQSDVFVIEDAREDKRFANLSLVTGGAQIRFYAAAPILTPDGFAIGTLCVLDTVPHILQARQRRALTILSHQVVGQFELQRRSIERDKAEEAAREGAKLLRLVIDLVPHHIFAKDRDGRFLFINRAAAASCGRQPAEMEGRTEYELRTDLSHVDNFVSDDREVIDSGIPKDIPEELITYPGDQIHILHTTKIPFVPPGSQRRAVLGVAVDITERKRADEERDNLSRLVERSTDFIALADLSGKIVFMNGGARKMVGIPADTDVSTLRMTDYVPEEWREFFTKTALPLVLEKGIWEGEMQLRHMGTGALVDVSRMTFLVPDEKGRPKYFATITRDIASRKQSEALLSGQKRVLEMIASDVPLRKTLTALLRIIEAQSPGMICSVLLLDEDGKHLRHGAAPSLPETYTEQVDGLEVGPVAGVCGTAVFRGEEVIVEDLSTDPLCVRFRDLTAQHNLRACWSKPIFDAQKNVLGTFAIYFSQPGRPTEHHHRLMEIAVNTAAIAIGSDRSQKAQRESLERFQIVSRVTNDVVWDWDLATNGVRWSDSFQSIFGYKAEEVEPGVESWENRIHPEDKPRVLSGIYSVVKDGGSYWFDEYRFRCGDGSFADIYDRAYIIRGDRGQASRMIGAMQDVTERKQSETRIRHLNRVYAVLSEINQTILREKDVQAIRNAACRIAVEKGHFRMAWMGLKDKAGNGLKLVAHAGADEESIQRVNALLNLGAENGDGGSTQRAMNTGELSVCNDTVQGAAADPWCAFAQERGFRSMASFPLKADGTVIGAFNLYFDGPGFFDATELQLLDELAVDIGFGLELNRRESQRVRAEKALRWRTAFFEAQVNSSPDAVLVVDSQGKIILRNEQLLQLFKVPENISNDEDDSKLLQHVINQAKYPDKFAERVARLYSHPNEKGLDEIELRDGTVLARYSAPVRDKDGIYYGRIWTFRDETTRMRAEESLRSSESSLQAVLNSTADGIMVADAQYKVHFANSRFMELWRIPNALRADNDESALLNYVVDQLQNPKGFLQRVIELYESTEESLDTVYFKDGRVFERLSRPLIKDAKVTGRVWSFRDITKRKHAEDSLRESEERFRQLAENIDEVFWIRNLENDQFLYVSPAYEKIWGRNTASVLNVPGDWLPTIHSEDRERVLHARRAKQNRGEYDETYRIERPDGSVRWIHDRAYPLHNDDGEVFRVVGTATDITENRKLANQLQQSQKMEAFGLLAGGVAHDFNNLLSVVIGYCDIWLAKLTTLDPIRVPLETIKDAGERAAALTRQLLAFSRQSVMESKVLDLNSVVLDTQKILSRMIGENIELVCDLDPEIPNIKVDPSQIGQVLINLAVNARDAMPHGGKVTIKTLKSEVDEATRRELPGVPQGVQVMLSVSDTGCGMTQDTMAHIFEPFFTTKEVGKGTGLGLAVVHGVVTQSGGTILVQSQEGTGTTFKLYFPMTTESISEPVKKQEETKSCSGSETILVVEDETNVRDLIAEVLEPFGYAVMTACNGEEALERLAGGASIDLLLTDVIMPGMSGRELADTLQNRIAGLKVLFMSGYTDDSILKHGVNQDEVAFIHKPFMPFGLLEKIRDVLEKK